MKKLMSVLLALVMVLSVSAMLATTASAEVLEGDWVTSRAGDAYDEGVSDYTPAAGYHYTTEGFETISPDFTNCNPYVQAHTKKAYNLKDTNADGNGHALSVTFTVKEFAYYGDVPGRDEWIAITLNSEPNATQGNPAYGAGLCILIRGAGDGNATGQPHYADKAGNLFQLFTSGQISPTVNEDGDEVYTFSITHDGTKYVMNLCGVEFSDPTGKLDPILDEQCADGVYLGVTLMTTEAETPAALVINEFQGEVPYGEDSAEPEANVKTFAPIADSTTIGANQPAVKWDGKLEQQDKMSISNADPEIHESGIVTLHCKTATPYVSFNLKSEISYEAKDFPVIAVLTKDCWASSGQVYYMAGKNMGATADCLYDFYIDDVDFGEGWCLGFIDLTDDPDWEGRINGIRVDFKDVDISDEDYAKFDIAYFGAFRSVEEATQYTKDYLVALLGDLPETTEKPTEEPTTEAPDTDPSENGSDEQTSGDDQTTEAPKDDKACNNIVAIPVVALVAVLGVAFVAKKKD